MPPSTSETEYTSPAISMLEIPAVGTEPTEEDVQRKPWKYIGYRGYSKFISSDDDFFVVRRFDTLSARVALALQDEIAVLEEELNEIDEVHSKRESPDVNNGALRDDIPDRKLLVDRAANKLRKYSKLHDDLQCSNPLIILRRVPSSTRQFEESP